MTTQATCREQWHEHKESRMQDLRRLVKAEQAGEDSPYARRVGEEIGTLNEYGLSFDYVPAGTFTHQRQGFWRYQISTGGPGEEFRFYSDGPHVQPHRVTFVFLDWFDGHERKLRGKDESLMLDFWTNLDDCGVTLSQFRQATE